VPLERYRTPARSGGGYSDAVAVDIERARFVHVAGQTPPPTDPPAGLAEQSERCFEQIEAILGGYGATLADVVQITVYLTDLSNYADFAAVRARVFGDSKPASAAVGVASLLDNASVEIAATAIVERTER
jgi:enamine deaminase RidA (YjgF/YER057c/UK114 family)